jgi:CRP/FNR family transcriptional regulator, cyclic AMP receptor protein
VTPRKRRKPVFDTKAFLAVIGQGRKIVSIPKGETIFSQGDACDAVFYIQAGKVKLTVVSSTGKEATIAILNAGDFFGEDSLIIQRLRMGTATLLEVLVATKVDGRHRPI